MINQLILGFCTVRCHYIFHAVLLIFHYTGGVPDSITDATSYYTGLVGCLTEFSLGNIGSIDMLARAERGRNVDICEKK